MPEYTITPAVFNYVVTNHPEFRKNLIHFYILKDELPRITLLPSIPKLKDNSLFTHKIDADRGFHTVALLIIYRGIYGFPSLINVSSRGTFVYNGLPVSGPPSLIKLLKDRGCGCR
jgi:hypothetical protein